MADTHPCAHCGEHARHHAHGLCHACHGYHWRTGRARPLHPPGPRRCQDCSALLVAQNNYGGRCARCYWRLKMQDPTFVERKRARDRANARRRRERLEVTST